MADVHSPKTRSYNMSQIHSKDTRPEEVVRKYLFSHGFRYRKNDPRLTGKPDIVLPKYKTVIFVNGCFWHHHEGCKCFKWPESNSKFWRGKINGNVARDERNRQKLEEDGWQVLIVWECDLKKDRVEKTLERLVKAIKNQELE